jgi:hypothetical protein
LDADYPSLGVKIARRNTVGVPVAGANEGSWHCIQTAQDSQRSARGSDAAVCCAGTQTPPSSTGPPAATGRSWLPRSRPRVRPLGRQAAEPGCGYAGFQGSRRRCQTSEGAASRPAAFARYPTVAARCSPEDSERAPRPLDGRHHPRYLQSRHSGNAGGSCAANRHSAAGRVEEAQASGVRPRASAPGDRLIGKYWQLRPRAMPVAHVT